MLYDPKWEVQTETKADPFALSTLIAWLEQQESSATYCYGDGGRCLLARYFQNHEYPNVLVGGFTIWLTGDTGIGRHLPKILDDVSVVKPWTYGAALERARSFAR